MGNLFYTNVGFNPQQYKLLKHIAVEEGRDVAALVRESVDQLVASFKASRVENSENDFFFQLGNTWKIRGRLKKRKSAPHDRTIYRL